MPGLLQSLRSKSAGTEISDSPAAGFRHVLQIVVFFSLAVCVTNVGAQSLPPECGTMKQSLGPFDYTDPADTVRVPGRGSTMLEVVEGNHFGPDVENLVRGQSSADILDDLEFTLRAFPNHHRALQSTATYHLRNDMSRSGRMSIDCWFNRAVYFRPQDATVRLVYGIYLARKGDGHEAEIQYKEALRLRGNMAEAHYNIGLLYAGREEYTLAYEHAERAYALGHPLPGLRNRLLRAGAWQEEPEQER